MKSTLLMLAIGLVCWNARGQIPAAAADNSCDAVFSAQPDSLNPMIIHFLDQSTGQITQWQWSFGDGSTSIIQNPVHAYQVGGTYFVCLTVSNSDSGYICHDVMCSAITIHEPGTCIADYTYTINNADPLKATM